MPLFPKRIKTSHTSEVGMNQVSSVINDVLGWMFRRVPGESDFGIDGHADIVIDDGSVTGRSLALQIKSGKSFLKETNDVGFVFRGEAKHLNYYANYSTPVIVVLCDPDTGKCYWEEFDLDRTDGAGTGWTMTIPFSQELCVASKSRLMEIAGPVEDLTDAVNQQWAVNRLLKDMGHIHYAVSRSDIETMDISNICSFFARLEKNVGVCKATQGKLSMSFSGYDDDPRELWEIADVRNWFAQVFPEIKYWFYFLDPDFPTKTIPLVFALLCASAWKVRGEQVDMDIEMMDAVMTQCWCWLNELTDRLGMSLAENERISTSIIKAMEGYGAD